MVVADVTSGSDQPPGDDVRGVACDRPASGTWPPRPGSPTRPCPGSSTAIRASGGPPARSSGGDRGSGVPPEPGSPGAAGRLARSVTVLTPNTTLYGYRRLCRASRRRRAPWASPSGSASWSSGLAPGGGRRGAKGRRAGRSVHRHRVRPGGDHGPGSRPAGHPDGGDGRDAGQRSGPGSALGVAGRQEGGDPGDPLPAVAGPPDSALPGHPVLDAYQPAAGRVARGPARRLVRRPRPRCSAAGPPVRLRWPGRRGPPIRRSSPCSAATTASPSA